MRWLPRLCIRRRPDRARSSAPLAERRGANDPRVDSGVARCHGAARMRAWRSTRCCAYRESLHATIKARYANMLAQLEQTIARVEALVQRQEEPTATLADAEVALIRRRIRLLRALIAAQAALG